AAKRRIFSRSAAPRSGCRRAATAPWARCRETHGGRPV
ncbi:MAG: hypothetical protein AVDCRST_MAG08-3784, partial [uncultured Acetobacteraceae bacterium]